MLWSDVKDWAPGNLETLAEDLRRTRNQALSLLDDVDVAEGRIVSTGKAIDAMLAASRRSRGSIEWFAGLLERLAAVTDHAGDGVRTVHSKVHECEDLADRSPFISINDDGSLNVYRFSASTPDETVRADEANAMIDADAAVLRQRISEALTLAGAVADEYSMALRSIGAEEAPGVYGEGGGAAADGRLAGAVDPVILAKLSDNAYSEGTSDSSDLPRGWHEVDEEDLRALGLNPSMFADDASGFNASLFVDADGRYVLAFRGSDPHWNDWYGNIAGAATVSQQQKQAVELGTQVRSALEANGIDHSRLQFTGHSLGGGLASMASIATGLKGTTFNPAGLGSNDIDYARDHRADLYGEASSTSVDKKRVTAYVSEDDILNDLQDHSPAPDAFGVRRTVGTPGSPEEAFTKAYEQVLGDGMLHTSDQYRAATAAGNAAAIKARLDAHGLDPLIRALEDK